MMATSDGAQRNDVNGQTLEFTCQFAPTNVIDGPSVIAGQHTDTLPHGHVVGRRDALFVVRLVRPPNAHGAVVAARRQPLAVRVERDAPHGGRVTGQRVQARPVIVGRVLDEQLDRVVVAGRGEQLGRRMPLHLLHVLRVRVQHGRTLELIVAHHLPNPHRLVAAAGGQQVARPRPRHALHLVLVALERGAALELARLFVPYRGRCVEAGRREQFAVPRPGHVPDGACVAVGQDCFGDPLVVVVL